MHIAIQLFSSILVFSLYLLNVLQVNAAAPWDECECRSQIYLMEQI